MYKDSVRASPQYILLEQRFPEGGKRSTGGTRIVVWWNSNYWALQISL
jgi:hypothetical protein